MKVKDIQALSDKQLSEKLQSLQQSLLELRMRAYANQLKKVSDVSKTKKTIARIKTIMRQRLEEQK